MNINALYDEHSARELERFTAIFREHFAPLCFFAAKMIQDSDEAKDVVASVFQKIWEKRTYLEPRHNIRALLYTSVRNGCLTLLEKRKYEAQGKQNLQRQSHQIDFENLVIRTELLEEIYGEVEALPVQCKKVFQLLYLEGLSTEKVANQLKLSPQTVRNHKTRAIALLRKKVFPEELFVVASVALSAAALLSVVILLLAQLGVW